MKKSTVIGIVVGLHLIVVGVLVFAQGCQTTAGTKPAPVAEPVSTLPPMDMPAPDLPALALPAGRPVPVAPSAVSQPPPPAKAWDAEPKTYTVKAGDTLGKIAQRHGLRMRELAALNNIGDPSKLRVGQVLMLPGGEASPTLKPASGVSPAVVPSPAAPKRVEPVAARNGVYTVQAGDTLGRIASRHDTTIAALCAANGIKRDAVLRIGQKLKLAGRDAAPAAPAKPATATRPATSAKPLAPVVEPMSLPATGEVAAPVTSAAPATLEPAIPEALDLPVTPVPAKPVPALAPKPDSTGLLDGAAPMSLTEYTAEDGDDLELVAKMWSVSVEDLRRANQLTSDKLTAGQVLKIPPR